MNIVFVCLVTTWIPTINYGQSVAVWQWEFLIYFSHPIYYHIFSIPVIRDMSENIIRGGGDFSIFAGEIWVP